MDRLKRVEARCESLHVALFRHVAGPTNIRFEMQRGPDRQDEADDHTLNDLETIRSFNHAR